MSVDTVECSTQAELDQAIKDGHVPILVGRGRFEIREGDPEIRTYGSSSPRVVAYGSSSPSVVAYGSSSPRVVASGSSSPSVVASGSSSPSVEAYDSSSPSVEAYDSSSPRVVAYGSSSPRVVASGSSSPSVEAYGSSSPSVVAYGSSSPSVEAYGSSSPSVEAYGSSSPSGPPVGKYASIAGRIRTGSNAKIDIPGAAVLEIPDLSDLDTWCDYHGLARADGSVVVYKAVDHDWTSKHGAVYTPGTTVGCDDFRDEAVCGNGLHFSPRPLMALRYFSDATRFVACRVQLAELVLLGDKCKAPRCEALWEVDRHGERVDEEVADAA